MAFSLKTVSVFAVLLGIFYLSSSGIAETFDPYTRGSYTVTKVFYNRTSYNLSKHLTIWAPRETGKFPVILLSGSFAGQVPADTSMNTVIYQVISHGFAVVNPWNIYGSPIESFHDNHIEESLDFLQNEASLMQDLIDAGASPDLELDFERMILAGHSAGNHINVNYLKERCGNFVAQILMSPVDGADPFGIIQDYCITPGELLNFDLPTLTMQAGLDPVKGSPLFPACGPEKLANMRFYNAMQGDRWFLNATAYGHTDFFEDDFVGLVDFLNFCGANPDGDKINYRRFVGGSIVAFAKAMLEPDRYCEMLQYVEDLSLMPVENIGEMDVSNRCKPASCTWYPPSEGNSTRSRA